MINTLIQYGLSGAIAALVSLITLFLKRKWERDDKISAGESALIKKLGEIEHKLDMHITADDARDAMQCRSRIQRFNDELLHGQKHSKESFDSVLIDCTHYNAYCMTHPDFPNEVTKLAEEHIREVYRKCMQEKSFL